jgi:hypothetical protein
MAREVKRKGSRKTVNADNLALLGAKRLAAILMDAAEDDSDLKRWLRLELAAEVGSADLALELTKRLAAIGARRSRIHWRKYKAFARDLDVQRAMIVDRLAELDPKLALTLLWQLLALADSVFQQVDDSRGLVEMVFAAAAEAIGDLVRRAKPDIFQLSADLVAALEDGDPRVVGGVAAAVLASVDPEGIAVVRAALQSALAARRRPHALLREGLRVAADAQNDVEGYIATLSLAEARLPGVGAQIARRLLAAGRIEDALAALAKAAPPATGRVLAPDVRLWEDVHLEALEADGQGELAQELRWAAFEQRLALDRLRAFLSRLPDFDDVEAEDRAKRIASAYPNATDALRALVAWPAASEAATLVLARYGEIDGGKPDVLEPAVRLLEARHPLAASLLLRALIKDTLTLGRADRYKELQRQWLELSSLAAQIDDWGETESHDAFAARMARVRRL